MEATRPSERQRRDDVSDRFDRCCDRGRSAQRHRAACQDRSQRLEQRTHDWWLWLRRVDLSIQAGQVGERLGHELLIQTSLGKGCPDRLGEDAQSVDVDLLRLSRGRRALLDLRVRHRPDLEVVLGDNDGLEVRCGLRPIPQRILDLGAPVVRELDRVPHDRLDQLPGVDKVVHDLGAQPLVVSQRVGDWVSPDKLLRAPVDLLPDRMQKCKALGIELLDRVDGAHRGR
jgi:hypothetical protein